MEDRVLDLEKRMSDVGKSIATLEATTRAHGLELRGVKQHLDRMDTERISPMVKKMDAVHAYCSKAEGIEAGKKDMSATFLKSMGVMIAAGGLVIVILKYGAEIG